MSDPVKCLKFQVTGFLLLRVGGEIHGKILLVFNFLPKIPFYFIECPKFSLFVFMSLLKCSITSTAVSYIFKSCSSVKFFIPLSFLLPLCEYALNSLTAC